MLYWKKREEETWGLLMFSKNSSSETVGHVHFADNFIPFFLSFALDFALQLVLLSNTDVSCCCRQTFFYPTTYNRESR